MADTGVRIYDDLQPICINRESDFANKNNVTPESLHLSQACNPSWFSLTQSTSMVGGVEKNQGKQEQEISLNNGTGSSSCKVHLQTIYQNCEFEAGQSSNRTNLKRKDQQHLVGLTSESTPVSKKTAPTLRQETQQINGQPKLVTLSQQLPEKLKQVPAKLKAASIPARLVRIGSWNRASNNEGDLVVKFYYGKKKLVWEFLFGSKKKKIEIRWSQITAINAFVEEDKTCRLEIELGKRPDLCHEINYQPKKHTQWAPTTNDFTDGQAHICRRHTVIFRPQVLDKPFENLLRCDSGLVNLSQRPFPSHNSPFFDNQILNSIFNERVYKCPPIPVINNEHREAITPYVPNPIPINPTGPFDGYYNPKLPTPDNDNLILSSCFSSPDLTFPYVNDQNVDVSYFDQQMYSTAPIREMEWNPEQLPELQAMSDENNGAGFTNQETSIKVDTTKPCEDGGTMFDQSHVNNHGIVFKESDSGLPVEAGTGMGMGMGDSNQPMNQTEDVYDEILRIYEELDFQDQNALDKYFK